MPAHPSHHLPEAPVSTETPRSASLRLSRILVNVVLVSVTLVATAYLVPSLLGYDRYVITGGSMSGAIEKGSIVLAEKVDVADLAVGDVITYQPPADSGVSDLVTHRVVTARDQADGSRVFRTQGDANADPDPWKFTLDQGTQARVTFAVPHLGYAVIALADRDTRMLLVGVPAGLIALVSLLEAAGALRTRRSSPEPAPGTGRLPSPRTPGDATAWQSALS
jgi:signal peptidase